METIPELQQAFQIAIAQRLLSVMDDATIAATIGLPIETIQSLPSTMRRK